MWLWAQGRQKGMKDRRGRKENVHYGLQWSCRFVPHGTSQNLRKKASRHKHVILWGHFLSYNIHHFHIPGQQGEEHIHTYYELDWHTQDNLTLRGQCLTNWAGQVILNLQMTPSPTHWCGMDMENLCRVKYIYAFIIIGFDFCCNFSPSSHCIFMLCCKSLQAEMNAINVDIWNL